MKIHTFTVVVGDKACNMQCPYCVSKMTPDMAMPNARNSVNWRNFGIAHRFAAQNGVSTILFTGKGEPTLYPQLITDYLRILQACGSMPFRELQTNGVLLDPDVEGNVLSTHAGLWYKNGMTSICISIAHYNSQINNELLRPNPSNYNFWRAVGALHDMGFSVRINCTMCKGYVDTGEEIENLLDACQTHHVKQTTVRMVERPEETQNKEVAQWVEDHHFDDILIKDYILERSTPLLKLPHNATVYDWNGRNICSCLTGTTDPEDIRQLIFFPDGTIRYDWKYEGAILL